MRSAHLIGPASCDGGGQLKYHDRLVGDRLGYGQPWADLLALPIALVCSLLFGATTFGRLLLIPFQIQFHELGHALVAWLSSRAALPLPFGFTFWHEQQSLFTGSCVVFLLALLLWRALREKRWFGVLLATLLLALFLTLSVFMSSDRSRMVILLGGLAGELLITALVVIGFYFRLPDKLRWDFFRLVLLGPAAACWLLALELWFGVWRGTRELPTGSIIGTTGDGSGDLDRLIAEHGFDRASLSALYGELALWTIALVALVYAVFAVRAWWRLRPRRSFARRTRPTS